MRKGEYAKLVDYRKARLFTEAMKAVGERTIHFPEKRHVFIDEESVGSGVLPFEYRGPHNHHSWVTISEVLGDQPFIAEWMLQNTGKSYFNNIAFNLTQIAGIDVIPRRGLPVVFNDVVATDSYDWGTDETRRNDFAKGIYEGCKSCGMALIQGETAAEKYLIKRRQAVLSAAVTGLIAPNNRKITGKELKIGDHIIAIKSSGIQGNGSALIIKRAMRLPEKFLTELLNGETIGKESLTRSVCLIPLAEALFEAEVDIPAFLPGTGGGPSKIASGKQSFTYRIHSWFDEIPSLFTFMRQLGVSLGDCLTTFNWGAAGYIFASLNEVEQIIDIGKKAGYQLLNIGKVEKGPRRVIFEPENITLSPPGE